MALSARGLAVTAEKTWKESVNFVFFGPSHLHNFRFKTQLENTLKLIADEAKFGHRNEEEKYTPNQTLIKVSNSYLTIKSLLSCTQAILKHTYVCIVFRFIRVKNNPLWVVVNDQL